MTIREFEGLEEITVNGKVYVNKKQLLQLIRDEKHRHWEATETGYLHKKEKQRLAAVGSLNHLAVLINKPFFEALHEDMFKYIVASGDGEKGQLLYFRGWCQHVPGEEGNPTPVFSEDPHDAVRFEDRNGALELIRQIREEHPGIDLNPVQAGWTRQRYGLRMIHAMFGWDRVEDPDTMVDRELELSRKHD